MRKFRTIKREEEIRLVRTTNETRKKGTSQGIYSIDNLLQELETQEGLQIEDLLQSVKTLEEELDNLPSIEDHLAEVERLAEQMKRDLEEYLNES